jgi:hypothetical protein
MHYQKEAPLRPPPFPMGKRGACASEAAKEKEGWPKHKRKTRKAAGANASMVTMEGEEEEEGDDDNGEKGG